MKSAHFFIGFEYPRKASNMARIYLNNEQFAGVWQSIDGTAKGMWILNRWGKALEMGLPICEHFKTLDDLLKHLENWLDERCRTITV
jgi:hypothetical protein